MITSPPPTAPTAHDPGRPLPRRWRISLRQVQVALGALWLLDGLLQLQPPMFTSAFVTQILDPVAQGQPPLIGHSITAMASFIAPHIAAWNLVFALVQLALGLGFLWRRTVRPAIVASLAWSLLVWWFAEGLGGLLTGGATPVTGAPGAVLLYALIALIAWPRGAGPSSATNAAGQGLLGDRGTRAVWVVLWVTGAVLILLPPNRGRGAIASTIAAAAAGEPQWLRGLQLPVAHLLAGQGAALALGLGVLQLAIGLGVLLRSARHLALGAGALLAVAFWVLGQSLGGILTGAGTDPNTGPLLVLLGATLVGPVPLRPRAWLGRRARRELEVPWGAVGPAGTRFDRPRAEPGQNPAGAQRA